MKVFNRLLICLESRIKVSFFYVVLFLIFLFSVEKSYGESLSIKGLPGVYIERITDKGATLVPALKMKYSLCVMQKNIARTEFLSKSNAWDEMKKDLSPEYISSIDKSPHAEPDWANSGIGISREKEYFYGDKYKQIKNGGKFRISKKDGLCRLESYGEYEKQYIDDGIYRYKVRLKNKNSDAKEGYKSVKIKRSKSPVLSIKKMDVEAKELIQKNSKKLVGLAQGEAWPLDLLKTSPNLNVNKEGLPCEEVESLLTKGSICYWSQMHVYPATMERPIILKKVQKVFQNNVVEKVVRFELHRTFKESVFKPPSKY